MKHIKDLDYRLLVILLAALLLRIHFGVICDAKPDFSDMALYNEAAHAGGIPTFPPPAYPLLLRIIYAVFGSHAYNAVYVVQGLLSTFTVYLIYLITRKVSSETAGLIAAGIAAVYPNLIAYNLTTMTEAISVFLVMALLAALTLFADQKKGAFLAAVTLSIGYLTRPAFILFFPAAFLFVKKRTIFTVALAVLLGSWLIYGRVTDGGPSRAAMLFYKSYNELANGISNYDFSQTKLGSRDLPSIAYIKGAIDFIAGNPWQAVNIIYNKAALVLCRGWDMWVLESIVGRNEYLVYLMYHHYLPVILLGIVGMIRRYSKRNRILVFTAMGYLLLHILLSIFKFRYRLLVEPIFIMFTGILIAGWLESLDRAKFKNFWKGRKKKQNKRDRQKRGKAENSAPARDVRESARHIMGGAKESWKILLILFAVALAVRMWVAVTYDTPPAQPDMVEMIEQARHGGLSQHDPPLYPAVLRTIFTVAGANNYTAVHIFQGIINAVTAILMFGIVTRVCNKTAGIIAAAVWAVYPNFLIYNVVILEQSLSLFFVCLLVGILATDLDELRKSVAAAIITGLAMLAQPVFVLFVPGLLAILRRRKAYLLVLLLVLLPWGIRNMAVERTFVPVFHPSTYKVNLQNYIGHKHNLAIVDKLYHNGAVIFSRGWSKMQEVHLKGYIYAARYSYMVIMILGLIGLVKFYRREQRIIFLPVLGYFIIIVLFSQFKFNLRVLIEPTLIMYAAVMVSGKCRHNVVPDDDRSKND